MARITRTRAAAHRVEVYRLDLDEGERAALRSAPGDYLRTLLENEGHTVDAVLVDSALDAPGAVATEVVHLQGGFMSRTWAVRSVARE
ncbi:hypothetical protein [Streptacidiphilus anmyonensis]|uniref:hypothetical protein n=1 Tax=Streptacidiphilus anmyonensis TaxID=405782 RepID=UPI0005A785B7|nr:hypothetical protein [Streptacidiphilus anmyonensis]